MRDRAQCDAFQCAFFSGEWSPQAQKCLEREIASGAKDGRPIYIRKTARMAGMFRSSRTKRKRLCLHGPTSQQNQVYLVWPESQPVRKASGWASMMRWLCSAIALRLWREAQHLLLYFQAFGCLTCSCSRNGDNARIKETHDFLHHRVCSHLLLKRLCVAKSG
jgi:hypothetical protein